MGGKRKRGVFEVGIPYNDSRRVRARRNWAKLRRKWKAPNRYRYHVERMAKARGAARRARIKAAFWKPGSYGGYSRYLKRRYKTIKPYSYYK